MAHGRICRDLVYSTTIATGQGQWQGCQEPTTGAHICMRVWAAFAYLDTGKDELGSSEAPEEDAEAEDPG